MAVLFWISAFFAVACVNENENFSKLESKTTFVFLLLQRCFNRKIQSLLSGLKY